MANEIVDEVAEEEYDRHWKRNPFNFLTQGRNRCERLVCALELIALHFARADELDDTVDKDPAEVNPKRLPE